MFAVRRSALVLAGAGLLAAGVAIGVLTIPSGGGTPAPIAGLERTLAYWPQVLPSGKSVLLTTFSAVSPVESLNTSI
jgi:hypothetical protein